MARDGFYSFGQMALRSARARGREGGFETPLPASGPRGAQSHLTERKNISRATSARTRLKKKPALPLARAERKPFDHKKKTAPRHQRENLLKENQAKLQESFARATGARDGNIPV